MEAYEKSKRENEQVWKRSGYKGIYGRLLKSGYFENSKMTKIEAAMTADMEEAVKLISLDNSM